MKYKIYGLITVLIGLIAAVYATNLSEYRIIGRVHQHKVENPAANDKTDIEFSTHLPLIIIDTKDNEEVPGVPLDKTDDNICKYSMSKAGKSSVDCKIKIINNKDDYNHMGDTPELEVNSSIRVRGHSSRYFEKKNYLLRFKEGGNHVSHKVLGMDSHYEWALHGPYLDKTLMRNYMWYNISGEIMDYAPNVRFCEVVLNDEYLGLYIINETITDGEKNRIRLKTQEKSSAATSYILRLDRKKPYTETVVDTFLNDIKFNEQQLDIKYPGKKTLTKEQLNFIKNDFSDFEKKLFSYDYDTNIHGYWKDINLKNFADYYIINEFTGNLDAGLYSTYIYRNLGGKFNKVVWDFNSCCDNYIETYDDGETFNPERNVWDYMLFKDERFTNFVIERYKKLRKTSLSEDYLLNYIDEVKEYLGPAVNRNFEVWGDTFDKNLLIPKERDLKSYDDAIEQYKNYIIKRGRWMDEHIDVLQQYSHESHVKEFNH